MSAKSKKWSWTRGNISNFFTNIDQMTPKAKASLVVKACRLMCDSIGVRFLSDSKVFWFSYLSGIMVLVYLILAIYTVCFYTYHQKFSHGIKATCVIGIAVPVEYIFQKITLIDEQISEAISQ